MKQMWLYGEIKTVGELKEFLSSVPNDADVNFLVPSQTEYESCDIAYYRQFSRILIKPKDVIETTDYPLADTDYEEQFEKNSLLEAVRSKWLTLKEWFKEKRR